MRALLALAACALASPAAAQGGWSVEAGAGRAAYDAVAARVDAASASLTLAYDGARRWGYASGGAPLDGVGPAWAAAGGGAFAGVRPGRGLTLGVNLAANGYGYAAADAMPAGGGASVEVVPTAILQGGPLRAQLSSGFVGVVEGSEGLLPSRRGYLDSNAGVAWAVLRGVELSAGARYVRGPDDGVPYAGGAAQVERGRVEAWAYGGAWLSGEYPPPAAAAGLGVRVRVAERTRVGVAFRREPADPIFRSLPRRSWSVSVRRGFGARPQAVRGTPAVPVVASGSVTFRLPRTPHDTGAPAVLGDFNGWRPVPMMPEGGFWTATLRLAPGTYHYAFRSADGRVHVPAGLPQVSDGFGGASAVLVVAAM